jgi:outer membrane protein TolC
MTGYALAQALQPLSQLYKISLSIYEQELATQNDNEQLRSQRQNVVANVKQDYYALLQTQSSIDDTNAYIKQYEETDRVTDQYLAQEAVLKSDSLTVKAQLAQYRYQLMELNNTLQTQKEQLNDLLGRNLDTDFRTEPVPAMSFEELDLKFAQQRALTQRPEIRQAEIGVKKADTDRKLAKAQYIPDISASIHYFTPINTELLPTNIATAGLEMSWDPWDWGRRRDDLKQKVIGLSQAQYQLDKARSQVLLDVNNNFRKLSQSRQLLSVTQAAKDAANEKLRETNDKFSKEAVLLRDVLQQQTAVANANKDYENALLSFWTARANFEKALGQE